MAVTAKLVKELREKTGAGMMDCKKALVETDGDIDKAIDVLREKGLSKAAKKADRIAAEGLVRIAFSEDRSRAAVVEVNSETDFVAKNPEFIEFVEKLAAMALNAENDSLESFMELPYDNEGTVKEALTAKISKIGENMNIRRLELINTDGFIVDYRVMHTMLSYFLNKVSNALRRARVVVGVPCGMTDVEQRAMMDAVIQAGAREVFLIERPVAAAIGCGVPIFEAQGSMVIDIGGGTIDMGIVSLGGIVDSKTIRFGGSDINNALLRYVRECFGIIVSDETIIDIKHTLGTAVAPLEDAEYAFQGRDMMNGLGRRCVIHQSEVYQVINECLIGLLDEVKQMIRATAPEIVADIMQHGIWLTGGTARLSGLADRIGTELGVPVHVPEAPETKVVVGLNGASSDLVSLSRFIVNSKNRKGRD